MATEFVTHRGKRCSDVVPALVDLAIGRGSVLGQSIGEEPFGEADRAKLHAPRLDRIWALAHEQLSASTADVDQENALFKHRERLQHTEMD